MDEHRFDHLVVTVAAAASRRRVVQTLLAAGMSGIVGMRSSRETAAACQKKDDTCRDNCCRGLTCCEIKPGVKRCRNLLKDRRVCGTCDNRCPTGERCVHGTCSCDPFNNTCPQDASEPGFQCGCGASVPHGDATFQAACVDRNSACDLERPCDTNSDCPKRSVCLLGCQDPPDPSGHGGRRCSKPCVAA